MAETFRSVFRQRKVEEIYRIKIEDYGYCNKYYVCAGNENRNILSDDIIGTYDVEIPLLEPGNKFYLHDINEVVTIKERMRSSDGTIIYYCTDKLIETENTKESFKKCQLQKEKFDELQEKNNSLKEQIRKVKFEFAQYKDRYKYKHRWLNFKVDKEKNNGDW